jgi:RimJ/RimL family protein N-acetyltransferase
MQRFSPTGVELGFEIFPPFRKQGYAREACHTLMEWAHRHHRVSEFVVSIAPDNEPSVRLAQALGFVKVGLRMDEIDGLEIVFRLSHPSSDAA